MLFTPVIPCIETKTSSSSFFFFFFFFSFTLVSKFRKLLFIFNIRLLLNYILHVSFILQVSVINADASLLVLLAMLRGLELLIMILVTMLLLGLLLWLM